MYGIHRIVYDSFIITCSSFSDYMVLQHVMAKVAGSRLFHVKNEAPIADILFYYIYYMHGIYTTQLLILQKSYKWTTYHSWGTWQPCILAILQFHKALF